MVRNDHGRNTHISSKLPMLTVACTEEIQYRKEEIQQENKQFTSEGQNQKVERKISYHQCMEDIGPYLSDWVDART